MTGGFGRKLLKKFTRMLTGSLKRLEKPMQYFQIPPRSVTYLINLMTFLCMILKILSNSCEYMILSVVTFLFLPFCVMDSLLSCKSP